MFGGFVRHAKQSQFWGGFKQGVGETFGWQYSTDKLGNRVHQGWLGRNAPGGMRANFLGNTLGLAFVGVNAYMGFKEGGMAGAAKSVATDAAIWGAARGIGATMGGMLNPLTIGVAVGAAVGIGYHALGEAGIARTKRLRNLEMGADITDNFGTMSTMRQRSLSAIQNSRVNGRLALGAEASLMHRTEVYASGGLLR